MSRIRENITYRYETHCQSCHQIVEYHVTDIRGVKDKYIVCPFCQSKINISENPKEKENGKT